jgi:hypothetical protein
MMTVRPQRLIRRLHRALTLGFATLLVLLSGLVFQSLEWVLIPPDLLEARLGDEPIGASLVVTWQVLWPVLLDWAVLLETILGLTLIPQTDLWQGLSTWMVHLPLALFCLALSLFELLRLEPELTRLRAEPPRLEPVREDSVQVESVPESRAPEALFAALDVSEEHIEEMQQNLDQLRVALINASLPQALDESAEPLEQARLACDAARVQLKALKGQQQVIQARAMGFRA